MQVCKEPYLLKPLTGCIISTTGFAGPVRLQVQADIERNGGTYQAELVKDRCTHLICAKPEGAKFKCVTGPVVPCPSRGLVFTLGGRVSYYNVRGNWQ